VGNESWKSYVVRRLQKTESVEAELTSCSKLVHSLLPVSNRKSTVAHGHQPRKADDDERIERYTAGLTQTAVGPSTSDTRLLSPPGGIVIGRVCWLVGSLVTFVVISCKVQIGFS